MPKLSAAPLPQDFVQKVLGWRNKAETATYHGTDVTGPPWDRDYVSRNRTIGDGEGFVIAIDHLNSADGLHVGENIAAQFVAKVVKLLYPKAEIENGDYSNINEPNIYIRHEGYLGMSQKHPQKKLVFLGIRDLSERLLHFDKIVLDMNYLKAANPGLSGIRKNAFRSRFRIPENKFVVNFYFKSPEGIKNSDMAPSMGEVLKTITSEGKAPDIVFASEGGGRLLSANSAFPDLPEGYHIMRLSEWATKYDPSKKWIVINDLRGYMPHLLNMTNLAVVSGPINIMEPLTAKVPTLFFNNPEVITEYNQDHFNKVGLLALSTKGAWQVKTLSEFKASVPVALKSGNEITPPYLVEHEDPLMMTKSSPLDTLVKLVIQKVSEGAAYTEYLSQNPPPREDSSRGRPFDSSLFY